MGSARAPRAGTINCPTARPRRILAFRPECNPPTRTTPASRTACDCKHFSPSPSTRGPVRQYSRRRWRTSWGRPGGAWHQQRTLLPVPLYTRSGSTTLKAPPPAKPLRARVTRCEPIRESAQDLQATPPAPTRRTRQSHDHAGHRDSATHTQPRSVGTVGRVAPRPAAATQKVTSMTSVQGKPTAVTPSAPVGTEQLVRSHPSCVVSFRGRGGGVFPRNPSPT